MELVRCFGNNQPTHTQTPVTLQLRLQSITSCSMHLSRSRTHILCDVTKKLSVFRRADDILEIMFWHNLMPTRTQPGSMSKFYGSMSSTQALTLHFSKDKQKY